MSTLRNAESFAPPRPRRWLPLPALVLLALTVAAPLAAAGERSAGSAGDRQLRSSVEALYEVLPVRGGLLLKPRTSRVGVRTIELRDGNVAVNGEPVVPSVLRAWLNADAALVLELAARPPADQRRIFGLAVEEGAQPPAQAPAKPPVNPAAESTDSSAEVKTPEAPAIPPAPEAPEPPEAPEAPRKVGSGPHVRVGGGVRVEPNEVADEVVAIGGPVHCEGEVNGNVTAVGGSAWINGRVEGSVTSVGGSVRLGPKAEVLGDATSIFGHVEVDPAAKLHGSKTEVSPGDVVIGERRHGVVVNFWPFDRSFKLIGRVAWSVFLALVSCLLFVIARPTVERLEERIAAEPWPAGLAGFLSQIFFLPLLIVVTLVLVISIIGCLLVLLYPVFAIALFIAGLLGYAAVAYRVGRFLEWRFGHRFTSPYVAILAGVAAIQSLGILGRMVGLVGPLAIFAWLLTAAYACIAYCAWTVGFGAFVLDRWGRGFRRQPLAPISPAAPAAPIAPESPAAPPPPAPDPWDLPG